jgi:putative flavoprotein involved in K+ transport
MSARDGVVVIGAGQAGLSVSHELTRAGVEHVVLERGRIGQSWRDRWETFCLVTPNWSVMLPGGHYDGPDPDGYMPRDEIVTFLERYAGGFGAEVREGVDVTSLEPRPGGGFVLGTSEGDRPAGTVILSTGAYQRPYRPPGAAGLSADLLQVDTSDYRSPEALPDGPVLVVGSGQSGCQIAEELHEAGRDVFLSCGRAPWAPRRLSGRDFVYWVLACGFMDDPVATLPSPEARLFANIQNSGHGGGHDLNYRTLQALGVTLLGRFLDADGRRARFAADLADSVAWGDARYADMMGRVRPWAAENGLEFAPPDPEPFAADPPEELDLTGFGAVLFTGGFRPDYGSWVGCPGAFDGLGFPIHDDGASTAFPGLYFVGVHFLRTRKSSLLMGVADDAAIVAERIAAGAR